MVREVTYLVHKLQSPPNQIPCMAHNEWVRESTCDAEGVADALNPIGPCLPSRGHGGQSETGFWRVPAHVDGQTAVNRFILNDLRSYATFSHSYLLWNQTLAEAEPNFFRNF